MATGNNSLLIFDFDNTITNEHMHGTFSGKYSECVKSDYNSGKKDAVTEQDIRGFLQKENSGIKNVEKLKSVLQDAYDKGVEVAIASFTSYPKAVEYVVTNHLGLTKEQADSVSVFSGFPQDYDTQLQGSVTKQQSKVGKNLHICKAIVKYKDKHGKLPKTVMLVDDDGKNIDKLKEFIESMSKRKERNGLKKWAEY